MQTENAKEKHVLVTGGAGFIGGHLVRMLMSRGERVVVLDDLSSGKAENIPEGAVFVKGSVKDLALLTNLTRNAHSVFHLAARVSVQACIDDWLDSHAVNLGGTITVFEAARRAGGVPVVYASSAAVYGDQGDEPCREDSLPAPISPYGADKLGCEHQARAMWAVHGLPSAGLRFFNVYGPGQDSSSPYSGVIARFWANAFADHPNVIFGDGLQGRDFVYVEDVVRALISARTLLREQPSQTVMNVCTGRVTTLLDLADALDRVSGRLPLPHEHRKARLGDIRFSIGDPSFATLKTGFAAETGVEEGLGRLWMSLLG